MSCDVIHPWEKPSPSCFDFELVWEFLKSQSVERARHRCHAARRMISLFFAFSSCPSLASQSPEAPSLWPDILKTTFNVHFLKVSILMLKTDYDSDNRSNYGSYFVEASLSICVTSFQTSQPLLALWNNCYLHAGERLTCLSNRDANLSSPRPRQTLKLFCHLSVPRSLTFHYLQISISSVFSICPLFRNAEVITDRKKRLFLLQRSSDSWLPDFEDNLHVIKWLLLSLAFPFRSPSLIEHGASLLQETSE